MALPKRYSLSGYKPQRWNTNNPKQPNLCSMHPISVFNPSNKRPRSHHTEFKNICTPLYESFFHVVSPAPSIRRATSLPPVHKANWTIAVPYYSCPRYKHGPFYRSPTNTMRVPLFPYFPASYQLSCFVRGAILRRTTHHPVSVEPEESQKQKQKHCPDKRCRVAAHTGEEESGLCKQRA